MAIAAFIDASRPQVAAIAASILAKETLAATIAYLSDTTAAVHEQLAILEAEYKLSNEMHAELLNALQLINSAEAAGDAENAVKDDYASEADAARLSVTELLAQRKGMLDNLATHLSDLRQRQVLLAHGIEHGSMAMTDAFSRAAVSALPTTSNSGADRGATLLTAYLVVAQLRDRLQAPGFRGIGEHAVTTLYVTAMCHSAKRRMDHALSDPMAHALAMELGFKSAKEVHQALQAFHRLATEKTSRTQLLCTQLSSAMTSDCDYVGITLAPPSLDQQFAEIMHRARQNSPGAKNAGIQGGKSRR
ncbi:MAG: hypothetical protein V4695_00250 [Pseudomonadota bacterium]